MKQIRDSVVGFVARYRLYTRAVLALFSIAATVVAVGAWAGEH